MEGGDPRPLVVGQRLAFLLLAIELQDPIGTLPAELQCDQQPSTACVCE